MSAGIHLGEDSPSAPSVEIQVARHDERLHSLEGWVPKLQDSVDELKKIIYRGGGAYIAIQLVIQIVGVILIIKYGG